MNSTKARDWCIMTDFEELIAAYRAYPKRHSAIEESGQPPGGVHQLLWIIS